VLAGAYNGCVGVVVYIIPLFVLWTPLDLPAFRTRGPHLLPKTRFFIFESFESLISHSSVASIRLHQHLLELFQSAKGRVESSVGCSLDTRLSAVPLLSMARQRFRHHVLVLYQAAVCFP
jgi:hypothetical protein